eukprot:3933196-Rhodomonas_salina.1
MSDREPPRTAYTLKAPSVAACGELPLAATPVDGSWLRLFRCAGSTWGRSKRRAAKHSPTSVLLLLLLLLLRTTRIPSFDSPFNVALSLRTFQQLPHGSVYDARKSRGDQGAGAAVRGVGAHPERGRPAHTGERVGGRVRESAPRAASSVTAADRGTEREQRTEMRWR